MKVTHFHPRPSATTKFLVRDHPWLYGNSPWAKMGHSYCFGTGASLGLITHVSHYLWVISGTERTSGSNFPALHVSARFISAYLCQPTAGSHSSNAVSVKPRS